MNKYKIGDFVEFEHEFTEADVYAFSDLSLDKNPIHLEETYAKNTVFKQRIVHGMLVSSIFSGLIASRLPGAGSIYLSQKVQFKKPVFFNQNLVYRVEIIHIRKDKPIITLLTNCYFSGELLVEGEAVVLKKD